MEKQLEDLEIECISKEIAEVLRIDSGGYLLRTVDGQEYRTKSIICSTGATPRTLGIESEQEFIGKGVSYCAICDGFFLSQ